MSRNREPKPISDSDKALLETLVDKYQLFGIIEYLAEIAGDKSRHIATNWQDEELAETWDRDAERLWAMRNDLDN